MWSATGIVSDFCLSVWGSWLYPLIYYREFTPWSVEWKKKRYFEMVSFESKSIKLLSILELNETILINENIQNLGTILTSI